MLRFVVAALCISAAATVQIDTRDGGYADVKVSIHEDVAYNESIVDNIKVLFATVSEFLHQATNGTVYFKRVRIEFSLSWPERKRARALSSNSFERSDVRINLPANITGDVPFTQQLRMCSEPGHFIQLAPGFLAQTQNMTASGYDLTAYVFVHQLAHFRYGVFDEFRTPGDAHHPLIYCHAGMLQV
ncbi:calcium-activated chloride channel regulator 2-like [Haemaphysalis longicornis]